MRIRLPFAGVFALLLLVAGYAGLSSLQVDAVVNDKVLHVVTFFALTVVFYWVVDTSRRRTLHATLVICTLALGVGSEFLQALLPNGRDFDLLDVVANMVGSLAGLGLCSWYHKRMLERKRKRKYTAVPTAAGDGDAGDGDLELGEGPGVSSGGSGMGDHEEGVTEAGRPRATTLEEEVDNWDENAADDAWDEDELGDVGVSVPAASKDADANGESGKKRSDL